MPGATLLCTEGSMRHSCNYTETEGRCCCVRKGREATRGRERLKGADRVSTGTHVGDQLCVLLLGDGGILRCLCSVDTGVPI